ncbi:DUF4198 domain-containing protein [Marinibacterium profundimaris]|uniref:DUF4198 domain-containing protein n=1 Tax=Marinibacterium profundimaris TaxID=1679460 RepID=A0A225NVS4_9RHOB|nr:DUF4198 domain-containing protein [Marinibacterium profundimaris]OWU77398.1 hypothetical protein ATO3_01415 [Marinibacterium profundimaris]
MSRPRLIVVLLACMAAGPGLGHEFWIEPSDFTPDAGTPVTAQLKNGEGFVGKNLIYFDQHFSRFDMIRDELILPVEGRGGDLPALTALVPGDGLWAIVHETTPRSVKYETWEKFARFAEHKDFPDIEARHAERDLPRDGFSESYTRHVKALVGVGDARGDDVFAGMETEFVALLNPYVDDLRAGLPVRLFYRDEPRAQAQVEIFDRAPDGTVTVTTTRTDDKGQALIPVSSGHTYLLDGVVLRAADPEDTAVWETLWAALTFSVP